MADRELTAPRTSATSLLRAAAASTLFFIVGMLLPVGGLLLLVLTPQPGLRLVDARTPQRLALVALVAAVAAVSSGLPSAALYLTSFGLITLSVPVVLDREWSIEVTIGVVTVLVAAAILVAVLASASPTVLLAELRRSLEDMRSEAIHVYQRAGLAADVVRQLEDGSVRVIEWTLRLAPALFVISIAAVTLVNVDLLRRYQRAQGLAPVFGDLTRWKSPPELVWMLIAAGYGAFLSDGAAAWFAANLFAVLLAVYFCQGLVIAQFYLRRWRSPLWLVGLVYVFIVLEWLVATCVTLVGVFDLWADFRRLNPRPAEED
jgi:uncharacterized protein YybS (DUF2232 family)